MKVFVIGTRGFPGVQGGIETHCQELYKRLAHFSDIEITVLAIGKYCSHKRWSNIDFVYIPTIGSKNLEKLCYGLRASIYSIMRRPDIVHFQGLNSAIYIPLLWLFRKKIVFTQHSRDYLYPKWGAVAKIVLKLSEKAALLSNSIIAVSHGIYDHLRKHTKRSLLIQNGADFVQDDLTDDEISFFIDKHGIKRKGYIFFAGRFTEEKAIEDLISAYDGLSLPETKLVIAGDADHESDYSRRIKDMARRNDNIVLTGFITGKELQVLYSQSRLFVLPSRYEGLPIALLEAVGYGVDVLASDIEANRDVRFLKKENFFKQGNIEDLRGKMMLLLQRDMEVGEKLERQQVLKREYSWNHNAAKTYEIYCSVLRKRQQTAPAL